ncbi:uncharacterized protein LOC117591196 [Drosophila guanche]|uniref:uncharacterized protein LOC117591196 n=1 Tax=Drosophila guanche TaxID=7266 RepID=UPI0014708AA2|nr:uncharacterized protein LOC117591196 [Drosophila guanche]
MFFGGDSDFQRLLRENGFDRSDLRAEVELNCTHPAILEFPNFMRRKSIASAVICFLLCMYLFILLAIVCDDYLVPSMERLCYTLRLTYDVAGATFLAAATSAPELFVAFVGTFIPNFEFVNAIDSGKHYDKEGRSEGTTTVKKAPVALMTRSLEKCSTSTGIAFIPELWEMMAVRTNTLDSTSDAIQCFKLVTQIVPF